MINTFFDKYIYFLIILYHFYLDITDSNMVLTMIHCSDGIVEAMESKCFTNKQRWRRQWMSDSVLMIQWSPVAKNMDKAHELDLSS